MTLALALALATGLLAGCASVVIESTPTDAEVGVIMPGEEGVRVVGRTPFQSDLGTLSDLVNEGAVTLVVRKRGFLSQHVLVPNVPHADLVLNASLLPDLPRNYEEVNRIVALVLKGQRLLLQKRFDEAVKVAAEIKAMNENVASAYEIEGAAFFMGNKLREARFAWVRVLELEPENHDAKGMLALVETRMGIRRPAAKKAGPAAADASSVPATSKAPTPNAPPSSSKPAPAPAKP